MLRKLNSKILQYQYYLLLIFLFILSILIYYRSFNYGFFIFDDYTHYQKALLYHNHSILDLMLKERTAMPIFYKLWSLLTYIAPTKHLISLRLINLVLHNINSILLFYIVRNQLTKKDSLIPILASILFFVHPAQVESVVWISSMKGVLSTFFLFVTWPIYSLHIKKTNYIYLTFSIVFYSLSLLTKVNVAIFPLVILALHFTAKKRDYISLLKNLSPFIVLSLLCVSYQVWTYIPGIEHHIVWYITHTISEERNYFAALALFISFMAIIWKKDYFSIREKIKAKKKYIVLIFIITLITPWFFLYQEIYAKFINFITISFYSFYKIIIPIQYSFDYGINQEYISQNIPRYLVSLIALIICIIIYKKRKTPHLLTALFLFLITSLPHLGLINFHFANISFYSDRYAYLALIPCFYLIKTLLDQLSIPKVVTFSLTIITIIIYSSLSYRNISYWKDNTTILKHSIKHTPLGIATKMALAHHYEQIDEIEGALSLYHKITMTYPNFSQAYLKRINLLIEVKRYKEAYTYAMLLITKIKELDPYIFPLIGRSLYMQKKYATSLIYFEKSLSLGLKNKGILQHIEDIKTLKMKEKLP